MAENILVDWGPEDSASLGSRVVRSRHSLAEDGQFEDEALIRLIDAHPDEASYVYVMGHDKMNYSEWQLAENPNLSTAELLDAIRRGMLWLNLVNMEEHNDEWRQRIDALFDELEDRSPGFRALQRAANLIVSSPDAMVHYHADAECNLLWHLRGRKQVWVYPVEERFASPEQLEMIFAREKEEDLPYEEAFDADAESFELRPGDVVAWPHNSPHRVENIEGLNVSLTTLYYSPEAQRRERVFLANKFFRSITPFDFRSTETEGLRPAFKSLVFRVMRKLGWVRQFHFKMPRTARVDPTSPTGYRQVDPEP